MNNNNDDDDDEDDNDNKNFALKFQFITCNSRAPVSEMAFEELRVFSLIPRYSLEMRQRVFYSP